MKDEATSLIDPTICTDWCQEAVSYDLHLAGDDDEEEATSAKMIFKIFDRLFTHNHG